MTSRYASNATERDDLRDHPQERPTHCDVTGCRSVFVGRSGSGVEIFKRGKADVFVTVNDKLRGVCCQCYAQTVNAHGKSRMSGLTDGYGAIDPAKVRAHDDATAQGAIPELAKMAPSTASDDEFFASHERDRGFA